LKDNSIESIQYFDKSLGIIVIQNYSDLVTH